MIPIFENIMASGIIPRIKTGTDAAAAVSIAKSIANAGLFYVCVSSDQTGLISTLTPEMSICVENTQTRKIESVLQDGEKFDVPPDVKFLTDGVKKDNFVGLLSSEGVTAAVCDWIADSENVELAASDAVSAMHGFSLLHIGINCESAEQSMDIAKKMGFLFGFKLRERPNSNFAGLGFEFMKKPDLGEKGHIGLGTNNAVRAAAYLERKGIKSISGSERRNDDGSLRRLYLDMDIIGFAIHLRRY